MTDERTTCAECGGDLAIAASIPTVGESRRCRDADACEERKGDRACFRIVAAA
jgi:hypothetical protein